MINKIEVLEDIVATVAEIRAKAEELNGKQKRQIRALEIMGALIDEFCPEEFEFSMEKELYQTIERKKGKSGVRIELHDGQTLIELLNTYAQVKDVYNKIKKACEEQGFKIVLDHIEKQ